jgi:hypothetical protein
VTDVEIARALESGKMDNAHFKHCHHLHVAWAYLSEKDSFEAAVAKMSAVLRAFAASAGVPEKYHETITVFWMEILRILRQSDRKRNLEDWVTSNPQLLEKEFPLRYYSRERLFSPIARFAWVEPDVRRLPYDASEICSSDPSCDASHWDLSRRPARN